MKTNFKIILNKVEFLAVLEQCTVSNDRIFCDEVSIEEYEEFKFSTDIPFTVEYGMTKIDDECNYGSQEVEVYCEEFILDAVIEGYDVEVEIAYDKYADAIGNKIKENL